ncbi:MAG: S41 family peptidase [Magnetococcales bacterium]|nr:S41 family peptidase [Magnetococcales bacterium]MBF0157836.1 S41 family peptidase [Magnetococcales bacterium]
MKVFFRMGRPYWFGLVALGVLVGVHALAGNVMAVSEATYEKLKVFSEVFALVRQNYVEEVDEESLLYGAIHGMLRTLDPHSSFLTPDSFKEMKVDTRGEFGGLGIEITRGDRGVKVVSPIEDTPAFHAGIKAGDLIIKIEDEATQEMDLMDAVKKMRGKPGTDITLTIVRQGETKPLVLTITRAVIKVHSVKWRMEEGNIGYARILTFNEQSMPLLEKAFEDLESKAGDVGLKGLVLDLRNDPGGLLDQAVKVSDAFLDEGRIVYTKGRIPGKDMAFDAQEGDLLKGAPMVVLINSGSASASEIVAGALQDHKRAVVMGTKSFGKGSVQTIIPLEDGSGLRLTTAHYFTPNGTSIQAKGITPDIVVEEVAVPGKQADARRLREADLKGHLENVDEKKDAPARDAEGGAEDGAKPEDEKGAPDGKAPVSDPEDKDGAAPGGDGASVAPGGRGAGTTTGDRDGTASEEASSPEEEEGLEPDGGESGTGDPEKPAQAGKEKEDYQLNRALDLLRGYQIFNHRLTSNAPAKP